MVMRSLGGIRLDHALALLVVAAFLVAGSLAVAKTKHPNGQTTAQDDPATACASCFISGVAPGNISSPSNGQLVPLCHSKGSDVFFYTVYDDVALHALISVSRIRSSLLSKCSGGRREFAEDPQLKALKIKQISPESSSSGYDNTWNRGHLGPSELFSFDKTEGGAWQQCYFTTNIAPQYYQFNQIGWRILEANVFQWSQKTGRDVFLITGTWYDGSAIRTLPKSGIAIPNYYYKIICDGQSSAAFAGKNVEGQTGMESLDYMTVDSWQEKTGLNFNFPASCNTGTVDPHYWNFTHNVPPAIIMPN